MRPWYLALAGLAAACAGDPGQHEITAPGELLTSDGQLREPGWAPRQLLRWDPARVHDPTHLRQWDFFTVMDERAAVNLTLVDLGFLRVGTVGVIDLASRERFDTTIVAARAEGFVLSPALEGAASFTPPSAGAPQMRFSTSATTSVLELDVQSGMLGPPVRGTLTLERRPAMPYLSLATPFAGDPHQFFFEQKVPGLTASGTLTVGERDFAFSGATGVIDWGRGQWPGQATWRWAAAAGQVGETGGVPLALNLGEGFGDAGAAGENLVVLGDVAHKLGPVTWSYDAADPLQPWTFRSADGRVELVLEPIAPELGGIDLGAKFQHVTKAYGRWRGRLALAGVPELRVEGLLGFAEHVELSW